MKSNLKKADLKQSLINHFVNLYRLFHNTNAGLTTEKLNKMSIAELKRAINSYQFMMNIPLSY
jgi:hypothetical protein